MLTITLLGEQAVVDAVTGEVRTRASRTIALLAHLVAHAGSPQQRVRLAGLFWPDSGDTQALTNLRRELHHLRQVLGEDAALLEVTVTHLCWRADPRCDVDLTDFLIHRTAAAAALAAGQDEEAMTHGARALTRYGGDLLPGMDDEWLLELRAELVRSCVSTCDLVCDAAKRTGRLEEALTAARRRITVAPLEERGYRTLMELQAELGDRADAITTYHRGASVLGHELGIDPDPATTRVLHRILGRPDGSGRAVAAPSRPPHPDLVGRTQEMGALLEAWQGLASGNNRIMLVHGAAGVGKTRLVTEFADHVAGQGAAVATTRCFEASGRVSLAPVAEWMRSSAISSARATLDPVWQAEAERLVPSPGADADGAPPLNRVDVWQRHRFFEGLARCVLAVSRPTLLVLDNLQWCDEDSLIFCAMLMTLAARTPVLMVATRRVADVPQPSPVDAWVDQMRDAGLLISLRVDPFDPPGTAALGAALTGEPLTNDAARTLHAATGGFPLYVVEAARSAQDLGAAMARPDTTYADILRKRVERTSPAARAVAGLAAAVGQDFDLGLLSEASDLEADTVALAVDELWRQRIVRERKGSYSFTHDALRDTAYAMVSPARRWLLHRRLAQALELLHSGQTDQVAAQVAAHYRAAGNRTRALAFYRQAARVASGVFAHAEAVQHYRSALTLLGELSATRERDERELECLEAMIPPLNARYGYSSPDLQATCERTIALAERLGMREERLTAMVGLWASRFVQGWMRPAYELADQVLSLVGSDHTRLGQAHLSLAGSALHLGRPTLAWEHFQAGLSTVAEEALSVGTRARVHTTAWAAHAAWTCGRPDTARELGASAVEEARSTGHQYSLAVALAYSGITHQLLGDREAVAGTTAELRALCSRCAFAYYGEWGLVLEGWRIGGADGHELALRGVETLRRQGAYARFPYWLSLVAETAPGPDARRAVLDEALAAAEQRQEHWWSAEVMRLRAAHDHDGGAARLAAAVDVARAQESVALLARCEADLAAAVGAVGER